jgi:hypothetical protein
MKLKAVPQVAPHDSLEPIPQEAEPAIPPAPEPLTKVYQPKPNNLGVVAYHFTGKETPEQLTQALDELAMPAEFFDATVLNSNPVKMLLMDNRTGDNVMVHAGQVMLVGKNGQLHLVPVEEFNEIYEPNTDAEAPPVLPDHMG